MSDSLHESHRWGQRRFYGEMVYVCVDCRVYGFEDEPLAFVECVIGPPPPPPPKMKTPACPATLESRDTPGHTHRCMGGHREGDHMCRDCRRWFGVKR